jgi:hypothetical protein
VVPILLLSDAPFGDLLDAVRCTLQPAGRQTLNGVTHHEPHEE